MAPLERREEDDVDFLPDAGFDLKYGVTSGLTLDLTVNTDFAQVEADEQQINLTRFSLFFPEKREFFLENANIFQFGSPVFGFQASPRPHSFFQPQDWPIRGKTGAHLGRRPPQRDRPAKYRLGILSMQTEDFEETPSTNFSVARFRRDILLNSDIGAIFVNKQAGGSQFNRTYGVDANLNFLRNLEIASFLLKTDTSETQGKDAAGDLRVIYNDQLLDIRGEYLSIQEDFKLEVGFVPRTGIRKSKGEFTLKPRPGERIPLDSGVSTLRRDRLRYQPGKCSGDSNQ